MGDRESDMKVVLVDVDSAIPNLALMRISAWHKARGDEVVLLKRHGIEVYAEECDRAYISCVFSWNAHLARAIHKFYTETMGIPTEIGGSGVDWGRPAGSWSALPPEVEACPPDYDLYGDDRAIGFCQRGCIRKCSFCLVSAKEGTMDRYPFSHPKDWVPDGRSKVLLLDNEFAAQPVARQRSVADWVRETGRSWSITQGYDVRILARRPELAAVLAGAKPRDLKFRDPCLYTAWDYPGIEPAVRAGITALLYAGFRGREILVYLLCGFNTTHDQDLHRFRVVWEGLGAYPYVMRYNRRRDDPWLNAFARYVNRKIFKSCAWEDYDRAAHDRGRRSR